MQRIKAIEKYIRELEEDANKLRAKEARNEMEKLINKADATLITDIANDLKERIGVS